MLTTTFLFFLISFSFSVNPNNRAQKKAEAASAKKGETKKDKPKKSLAKERLADSKRELTDVAMSFSREELFDKSPHEISNAYVRLYQGIGEVLRLSHQYNVIDSENQKGIAYVAHMLNHISQQSNSQLDKEIVKSIVAKIADQKAQTDSITAMANEISMYSQKAAQSVSQFEIKMKETKQVQSTSTFVYLVALSLQALTAYFVYIIIFKRRLNI
ncbi:hypothetical protein EIN_047460 [Entamoeba invadens IP1]|uniref:GOLD domain-containing protein n=1 Tax=Entamoeba invadens IP1 TaxID=370355 RepID=A0A0A1UDD6_ENTIV|nr:hypothetical protein EIN_047460 [Entamoeba invadens IP1]ELP94453.1 hypothetical protein EIN_047460 [Entamoeba invadens IP1]|eukprot:XP_004261224.1 hypothetical protein EIN_047460 [Entamoeba invadens IP1]